MVDGIIKGTGNSRYLRSVSNVKALYGSFDAFLDALAAGTFPIDLNGINPAGWDQVGMKLEKANLLTDTTATSLGLTSAATPDQAIEKLRQMVGSLENEPKIVFGSYQGTGTYGAANPSSLTFPAPFKFVWMYANLDKRYATDGIYSNFFNTSASVMVALNINVLTTNYRQRIGFNYGGDIAQTYGKMSADGKTISWYNSKNDAINSAQYQMNAVQVTYYYLAILL